MPHVLPRPFQRTQVSYRPSSFDSHTSQELPERGLRSRTGALDPAVCHTSTTSSVEDKKDGASVLPDCTVALNVAIHPPPPPSSLTA